VLFGAVVMLGLGGLGGAAVILRVTDAIRTAELAAFSRGNSRTSRGHNPVRSCSQNTRYLRCNGWRRDCSDSRLTESRPPPSRDRTANDCLLS